MVQTTQSALYLEPATQPVQFRAMRRKSGISLPLAMTLRWVTLLTLLVGCVLPVRAQQTNLAAMVRHAPSLSGSALVEGSVQQLLGESVTFNSGFTLTGDLLIPGTPTVVSNGAPTFAGLL